MVRNTKGGSKHKKFARKATKSNESVFKTRLADPTETCEMYANVIKLLGNGMCEVKCNDGKRRLCFIRNKFRGKNRRQNIVSIDSKVLIGIRDWETTKSGKLPKCDLLEVYHRKQEHEIRNDLRSNWEHLMSESEKAVVNSKEENDLGFDFDVENGVLNDKEKKEIINETNQYNNVKQNNEKDQEKCFMAFDDEEINIDDI